MSLEPYDLAQIEVGMQVLNKSIRLLEDRLAQSVKQLDHTLAKIGDLLDRSLDLIETIQDALKDPSEAKPDDES